MQAFYRVVRLTSPVLVILALAASASAQTASSDQAKNLLQQGIQQYKAMDFKAAQATFLNADKNRDALSEADRKTLDDYLTKVPVKLRKQESAQEAYKAAGDALKNNDFAKAEEGFAAAAGSDCLPKPVRDDAAAQLALVKERRKAAEAASKSPAPVAETPATAPPATVATTAKPSPATVPVAVKPTTQPASDAEAKRVLAEKKARRETATKLVDAGNAAMDKQDFDAAVKDFEQAQALAPDLDNVAGLLAQARTLAGTPPRGTALSRLQEEQEVKRQAANVEFDKDIKKSNEILAKPTKAADFDAATDAVRAAQNVLETGKTAYPADEYQQRVTIVQDQINWIRMRRQSWEETQSAKTREDIAVRERERQVRELQDRQRRIATLTGNAKTLIAEHKNNEALDVLNEILQLDPSNQWAAGSKDVLEQSVMLGQEKEMFRTGHAEEQRQFIGIREAEIPWYEILKYPRDWRQLTALRTGQEAGATESEADRAVRQRLKQRLAKLDFDGIEFQAVVQFFRDVTGASIYVKWNVLSQAGIEKTAPVNVHLADVTFEKALRTVLDDVGATAPLGFVVDEGVITISTKEDFSRRVVTKVYDIRDLTFRVPNFVGPSIDISNFGCCNSGNNQGGGSGSGIFSNQNGGTTNANNEGPTQAELIQSIIDLIKNTIDPTSWRPTGELADIRELHGELVVTQTAENHERLMTLISQLREARALQVSIEARFITVTSGFLNSIGVDLDFYFNLGSTLTQQTKVTDPWTGSSVPVSSHGAPWWTGKPGNNMFSPIPVQQNSSGFTNMIGVSSSVPNSIGGLVTNPALTVGGTFLDDVQVDFLVQATQANQSTRSLNAPRLTLFNGQRAFVTVGTEQAYVANLTPVVVENAVAYTPTISQVGSGVTLDVEATVSADRRYVTLTIRPSVSILNSFSKYFTTVYTTDAQGNPLTGEGAVQLPNVTLQIVETTVSVPDGGTLLLGGQKLSGEIQREMGVPMLDKIPIINRLTDNRGSVRDESMLLILVKPKIIIQHEEEDKAFPPM